MKKDHINHLLKAYLDGNLSPEQRKDLASLSLDKDSDKALVEAIENMMYEKVQFDEANTNIKNQKEILNRILSIDKTEQARETNITDRKPKPLIAWRWAAAACVSLLLGFGSYELFLRGEKPGAINHAVTTSISPSVSVNYTRNITLPDGSTVILSPGSTLDYVSSFSSDIKREVHLKGEAYFDIAHRYTGTGQTKLMPFIIYTGKIRTVVLGTAFNVKAYPDQSEIIVSVTRGKVRLEEDGKVLGVLTRDEQLTYNTNSSVPKLAEVDANRALQWTQTDMEFDGVSFEKIAETLRKRYAVEIVFKNKDLGNCLLVSSFSGTESLENVLETLCTVLKATYQTGINKTIVISGTGCP